MNILKNHLPSNKSKNSKEKKPFSFKNFLFDGLFFVLVGGYIFGTVLFGGFVFAELFGWFIAPVFGIHAITALNGAGIILMCNFILSTVTIDMQKKERTDAQEMGRHLIVWAIFAFTWLLGFIIHWFM